MEVVIEVAGEPLERVYTVPPCGCSVSYRKRDHAEAWAEKKLQDLRARGLTVELKAIREK